MKRPLVSVLPALGLAAVLCLARSALAQITTDATTSAAPPDIVVILETHTKGISAATAARLNAAAPKFSPPVVTPPGTPATAVRLEDKPKNGIVRLPNYIINEPKAPAFKERELLTGYGQLQLAYKRHPGLHFGSLPFLSNNGWALAMLEEDFTIERKKEMEELAGLITDPTARAHAKDETQAVFTRTSAP
jgi:hypothetical protein